MKPGPRRWFSLAVLAALAACNPNTLSGSIEQRFSLAFTSLTIFNQPPYVVVEYDDATTGATPCKMSVTTTGLNLTNGSVVNGATFLQDVTFTRVASDGNNYKQPLSGQVTFNQFTTTVGGTVAGSFNSLFTDGFLVLGNFSGPLTNGSGNANAGGNTSAGP